jgi:hypothetical protein
MRKCEKEKVTMNENGIVAICEYELIGIDKLENFRA